MAKEPTPIEAFLAPLARIARKHRDIEGLVFWGGQSWDPSPSEALDAEEIAFYAEGLLIDGFKMDWALVAEGDAPDHLRLCFWQEGEPPPPVQLPWRVLEQGRWAG
ncbi:hypothetical protein [Tabrizicola sp.]|uniref:hypothetical protein n=1 Tax=Tabrizicola sp. TaxID=2005166 RepID=UPI0025FFCF27|nr:hypothetical protein [Tabrizicola sp.]